MNFISSHSFVLSLTTLSPPPAPSVPLLCLSMPPRRESLDKVKTRLQIELQRRTDKRVSELLNPKPRESDIEIFDDSEEEDRLH